MGHPQPKTPIQTNNSTAEGIIDKINPTQMNKSNGHAIPLATQSGGARTIQNLLAPGKNEPSGLFHKTPFTHSPCQRKIRIFDQSQGLSGNKTSEREQTDEIQANYKLS